MHGATGVSPAAEPDGPLLSPTGPAQHSLICKLLFILALAATSGSVAVLLVVVVQGPPNPHGPCAPTELTLA